MVEEVLLANKGLELLLARRGKTLRKSKHIPSLKHDWLRRRNVFRTNRYDVIFI